MTFPTRDRSRGQPQEPIGVADELPSSSRIFPSPTIRGSPRESVAVAPGSDGGTEQPTGGALLGFGGSVLYSSNGEESEAGVGDHDRDRVHTGDDELTGSEPHVTGDVRESLRPTYTYPDYNRICAILQSSSNCTRLSPILPTVLRLNSLDEHNAGSSMPMDHFNNIFTPLSQLGQLTPPMAPRLALISLPNSPSAWSRPPSTTHPSLGSAMYRSLSSNYSQFGAFSGPAGSSWISSESRPISIQSHTELTPPYGMTPRLLETSRRDSEATGAFPYVSSPESFTRYERRVVSRVLQMTGEERQIYQSIQAAQRAVGEALDALDAHLERRVERERRSASQANDIVGTQAGTVGFNEDPISPQHRPSLLFSAPHSTLPFAPMAQSTLNMRNYTSMVDSPLIQSATSGTGELVAPNVADVPTAGNVIESPTAEVHGATALAADDPPEQEHASVIQAQEAPTPTQNTKPSFDPASVVDMLRMLLGATLVLLAGILNVVISASSSILNVSKDAVHVIFTTVADPTVHQRLASTIHQIADTPMELLMRFAIVAEHREDQHTQPRSRIALDTPKKGPELEEQLWYAFCALVLVCAFGKQSLNAISYHNQLVRYVMQI